MKQFGHSLLLVCLGGMVVLALDSVAVPSGALPAGQPRSRMVGATPPAPHATPAVLHAVAPAPGVVADNSFTRYEVILSRKPFGDEAAMAAVSAAAAAANAPPVESFAKTLTLQMINTDSKNRIVVGLFDSTTKKVYILHVGDTEDGIEIKDADYENSKAVLRKGTEEVSLTLNAASPSGPVVSRGAPGAWVAPTMPKQEPPAPVDPTMVNKHLRVVDHTKNVPKLPAAELQKRLQDYQMELIRSRGEKGPPLPMQLTPEMDAQLVKEGALPPNE